MHRRLGVRARQLGHERRLANGGEPKEVNAGVACGADIKALATAAARPLDTVHEP